MFFQVATKSLPRIIIVLSRPVVQALASLSNIDAPATRMYLVRYISGAHRRHCTRFLVISRLQIADSLQGAEN